MAETTIETGRWNYRHCNSGKSNVNGVIRIMNLKCLESIRSWELERALLEIRSRAPRQPRILEIGAGSGWQAKTLAESGYSVEAIDVEHSTYSERRIWPVLIYDGKHIPFPDTYFDIVFSSNVLEHIDHIDEFQYEMKRVLRVDGLAIHVVPSGSWRLWTNVAHYLYGFKTITSKIFSKKIEPAIGSRDLGRREYQEASGFERTRNLEMIKTILLPQRHGTVGNALSEVYYFSRYRWRSMFERSGWEIETIGPNRLFYTGYLILGSVLSVSFRTILSYILGSSCHIFVLRRRTVTSKPRT